MKKTTIAIAVVLGLVIGGFILKEVLLQDELKSWQEMGINVQDKEELSEENLSREMAKKWLEEDESLSESLLKTLSETEEAYAQWEVDYQDSKYFRIMTYSNSVRRAQISNLVGALHRDKQQKK